MIHFVMYLQTRMALYLRLDVFRMHKALAQPQYLLLNSHGLLDSPGKSVFAGIVQAI